MSWWWIHLMVIRRSDPRGPADQEAWPDLQVIAGNVVTEEGTLALTEAGVDAIKVGVGAGTSAPRGRFPGQECRK